MSLLLAFVTMLILLDKVSFARKMYVQKQPSRGVLGKSHFGIGILL